MPYLGDLIGHLVAEIVIGRTQADIESLRIAELYANHPLLKHLTVPRFRLPNITLDVPFAISDIGEIITGQEPRGKLAKTAELIATLENTIRRYLGKLDRGLSVTESKEMNEKIAQIIDETTKVREVPISISSIADELASEAIKIASLRVPSFKPDSDTALTLRDQLKDSLRRDLLSFMEKPPRLRVLATSKDLEAIKDPNAIIHLRLTVSEEGIEWTVVDGKDRLVEE